MTLQAELKQILQTAIGTAYLWGEGVTAGQVQDHTKQVEKAILAAVSKHLPEKITDGQLISVDNVILSGYPVTTSYNTAITEMEKTLGGNK